MTDRTPPKPGPVNLKWWLLLAALALLAIAFAYIATTRPGTSPAQGKATTPTVRQPEFVANTTCLTCHAAQAAEWAASHHAHAMEPASSSSVRGDFNGRVFQQDGSTARFYRRDAKYFVHTEGPDAKPGEFEIAYAFGVEPLQQYLIAMPGGRLQALQIAWDTQKKQWFNLRGHEKTPPGDALHWTGRSQTANTMCITCHTTAFQKNFDPVKDSFASVWKEANVSCQACHGPGEQHLRWAQTLTEKGAARAAEIAPNKGLTVDLQAKAGKTQDSCAACHSRRSELSAQPMAGQPLLDNYLPSLLREGLYYADGQQRDEVYVDGSFRQSKMFRKGVTCTNCHNPHSGKTKLEGNALCLQCHGSPANPLFPTAAAKPAASYDSPAHHFHQQGSAGAQCVNCHMPSKAYMQIQLRPDHSLRIPRPDLSVKTGVPNACNNCHVNKSAAWAATALAKWLGPSRHLEPHYGEAFAAYRAGSPGADQALVALIGPIGSGSDKAMAPIVRASALDALRDNAQTGLAARIQGLYDPDDAVRTAAVDGLALLPPGQRLELLAPRLSDPVRAVRLAAARCLSSIPRQQFSIEAGAAFDQALQEYIAVQKVSADMPGARLNLAVVYQNTGQTSLVEGEYLAALRLDPDFTPARLNLAQFYATQARVPDAERVLQEGLAREPKVGEMHYSLALLLAQDGNLPAALDSLKKAASLLPHRGRVQYNLALAYQRSGQLKQAEQAYLQAASTDPNDGDVLYALAAFYYQGRHYAQALPWFQRFADQNPNDPRVPPLRQALAQSGLK